MYIASFPVSILSYFFYQPGACEAHEQLQHVPEIALCFPRCLFVCLLMCPHNFYSLKKKTCKRQSSSVPVKMLASSPDLRTAFVASSTKKRLLKD